MPEWILREYNKELNEIRKSMLDKKEKFHIDVDILKQIKLKFWIYQVQ
jgi:hypothetical protein